MPYPFTVPNHTKAKHTLNWLEKNLNYQACNEQQRQTSSRPTCPRQATKKPRKPDFIT